MLKARYAITVTFSEQENKLFHDAKQKYLSETGISLKNKDLFLLALDKILNNQNSS